MKAPVSENVGLKSRNALERERSIGCLNDCRSPCAGVLITASHAPRLSTSTSHATQSMAAHFNPPGLAMLSSTFSAYMKQP